MKLQVTCTKCANEVETRVFKPVSLEEKEKALTN